MIAQAPHTRPRDDYSGLKTQEVLVIIFAKYCPLSQYGPRTTGTPWLPLAPLGSPGPPGEDKHIASALSPQHSLGATAAQQGSH